MCVKRIFVSCEFHFVGDFVRVKAVIGKAALNNEIFRIESGRFFLISFYCKIPFRRSISVSMRHKKSLLQVNPQLRPDSYFPDTNLIQFPHFLQTILTKSTTCLKNCLCFRLQPSHFFLTGSADDICVCKLCYNFKKNLYIDLILSLLFAIYCFI